MAETEGKVKKKEHQKGTKVTETQIPCISIRIPPQEKCVKNFSFTRGKVSCTIGLIINNLRLVSSPHSFLCTLFFTCSTHIESKHKSQQKKP